MSLTVNLPAVGEAGPGWATKLRDAIQALVDAVNAGGGGGGGIPAGTPVLQYVVKDEVAGTWSTPQPAADDTRPWVWIGSLDADGNSHPGVRSSIDVLFIRR